MGKFSYFGKNSGLGEPGWSVTLRDAAVALAFSKALFRIRDRRGSSFLPCLIKQRMFSLAENGVRGSFCLPSCIAAFSRPACAPYPRHREDDPLLEDWGGLSRVSPSDSPLKLADEALKDVCNRQTNGEVRRSAPLAKPLATLAMARWWWSITCAA